MKLSFYIFVMLVLAINTTWAKSASKPPPPRVLKKLVELGKIESPAIKITDNLFFDFQFVANSQMYHILSHNDEYAFNYIQPVDVQLGNMSSLSAVDRQHLRFWKARAKTQKRSVAAVNNTSTSIESLCMRYNPMIKINGAVKSFELVSTTGLSFGFGGGSQSGVPGIDINYKLSKSVMEVSVSAAPPLIPVSQTGIEFSAKETQKQGGGGFSLNLGKFRIGPQFYHSTPLAQVTEKAFRKALAGLKTSLDKDASYANWYTRVLDVNDSYGVILLGGTNTKIKAGDKFAIYNELSHWQGAACASPLTGSKKLYSKDPTIVEVTDVSEGISWAKVITPSAYQDAVVGARVEIHQLAP